MSSKKGILRVMQNSGGMISAEFIFALVLCVGLSIVMFSLNFTLSLAEVAQYIAFSSARAHAAGHLDQDKQEQKARAKFAELTNAPALKALFNKSDGGWFRLTDLEVAGGGASGKDFSADYPLDSNRVPQVGVRFKFVPQILNLKVAFLGSTSEDDASDAFSAKITGLLIREPTQKECWDLQIKPRYSKILDLDPRYKVLAESTKNQYVPTEDNGC